MRIETRGTLALRVPLVFVGGALGAAFGLSKSSVLRVWAIYTYTDGLWTLLQKR